MEEYDNVPVEKKKSSIQWFADTEVSSMQPKRKEEKG